MLTKEFLRKKFAEDYAKHYEVELFRREGFSRRVCSGCGKGFWSIAERKTCGDSSHEQYSFIKEKPGNAGYVEFWKKYSDFWKKNNHEVLPRYPVLSRWRDDLFFTIASIVDFQRLEGGKTVFEYPANPLVVPQMCLRFNDIANVGVTGRHFSCFMMAGQHAFDCDDKSRGGYWKDECLQLNFDFLTQVMAIPKEEITYGEDVWSIPDFSSFGPCIESFSRGSELVNSVFTEFRAVTGADGQFAPLDMKVIDVGWGFERLLWYYNGSPSAYDAVFAKEIEFMRKKAAFELPQELMNKYSRLAAGLDVETTVSMKAEKEKIAGELGISLEELEKTIAPSQGIYAIADHSRALLFALTDGALPSNAAGGYNLRVLLRRAMSFINEYSFNFELIDLMRMQASGLRGLYPELSENLGEIQEILAWEKQKFKESLEKAKRTAAQTIASGKPISTQQMQLLYESHGVTPELLEEAGKTQGKQVEVPTDFYRLLTEKHVMRKKEEKPYAKDFRGLPATKKVFYEKPLLTELHARVLAVRGNKVALDETIFYPEAGGQAADKGWIAGREVTYADQVDGVVVHHVVDASGLREGQAMKLVLDATRRNALMRHHSATHVVIQSAQRVLGKHVWQYGSRKEEDEAHVDITHYRKLSAEEREKIEALANEVVLKHLPIHARWLERGEAEKKYGFRLYQGGGAIGKTLRVIEIEGFDAQACGGIHLSNTSQIGFIKIIGSESIQDGVVRLRYVAGPVALAWVQKHHQLVEEAAETLSVPAHQLKAGAEKMLGEWKEKGKKLEKAGAQVAELIAEKLIEQARKSNTSVIEAKNLQLPHELVEKIVLRIAREKGLCALASNTEGFVAAACNEESELSAKQLLQQAGAKGGGSDRFARGKLN